MKKRTPKLVLEITAVFFAAQLLFALSAALAARCGQSYTFILIADNQGPLALELDPYCCGLYDARGIWPAIDVDGVVAFRSGLDAGGYGLFTGNGHYVRTLVLDQTADPGSDFVSILSPPAIATVNNAWHGVAFYGTKATDTFPVDGIFRARFGFNAATITLNDPTFSFHVFDQEPSIRSNGDVVFMANNVLEPGNPLVVVSSSGGNPKVLFDSEARGIQFQHAVANRTDVAFLGQPDEPPYQTGIYRHRYSIREHWEPDGDFTPRKPAISDHSICPGGFIAAMIDAPGNVRRLYRFGESSQLRTMLVDSSADNLDLYTISSVDGNGCVTFLAYDRTAYMRGVYVADEDGINKVIEVGDELLGSWVLGLELYKRAMNSRGQITFWARLGGGRNVIVRADPVSTPCLSDLNEDGDADGSDLGVFADTFGSSYGEENYDPQADFNDSGTVDLEDLSGLALQFGGHSCTL